MNERTLHALEYDKIIYQLKNEATTSLGEGLIAHLKPSTNINQIKQMQLETDEAMYILRLNKHIPLEGIYDIRESVHRSNIGSILNIEECLHIASTIHSGRNVKRFIQDLPDDLPILKDMANRITGLSHLERRIKKCIDEQGNVLDQATTTLQKIRSSIRKNEHKIRDLLNEYTHTKSHLLSETIITIRNERYVLPVKQEYRQSLKGIVHDQSTSGQTIFMEPQAVVELNNTIQNLATQEQQEIERILRQISKNISANSHDLLENIEVLSQIDFIYARAKLGKKMDASMPEMNDQGIIRMQRARHPLIPKDEVVANDIEIGTTYTAIVITGPNTGGKTVTLKLIGLCTLMAQSGLQIPALDGCQLAVFDRVFADIGDEQSIEQNLSTFSSHMRNIVDIVEKVNDRTLVLFDELGAGTDPQEGAALAMAILDEVISRDARVVATTHYPELKAYGYNRENVINASVEFDIETLQPTYRLLIGMPGRSNAFDISKQLGLDQNIIKRAESHIGIDSKNVESMIHSLEQAKRRADKAYDEAYNILLESETLYHDLKRAWSQFKHQREALYKQAEKKAKSSIQKAKREAEAIVERLRERQSFKEHEWIDAKKQLEEAHLNLTTDEEEKEQTNVKETKALQPGDHIKWLKVNQTGTVLEKVSDDEYMIQVGVMKVTVKRDELTLENIDQEVKQTPVATVRGTQQHVSPELDLRGQRYEDAIHQLEGYIDDALLANYSKVMIIHGKGTGTLRKGVQQFCKEHPRISSFREGQVNEGGSGVTVIKLK